MRAAPPASVPASVALATDSLPPSARVAVLATVSAGAAIKRPAVEVLSVPLVTVTVEAAAVPPRVEAPVEVSVPAPRLAVAPVLPPFIA